MLFDIVTKLKLVKYITLLLFIIAAGFVSFGEHYAIAIVIMTGGLLGEWLYYRCPHYKKHLDVRMTLNDSTHCPYCGKVISHIHTG